MSISNFEDLLVKIEKAILPDRMDLVEALSLSNKSDLNRLFSFADKVRHEFCGDGIFLRGIIEFSNYCIQNCFYCGLNKDNLKIKRYRMKKDEVLRSIEEMARRNVKTVVMQSGEDPGVDPVWLQDIISEIRSRFDMAITLSVGERSHDDYKLWKNAGVDRYLLKIETSNKSLYNAMHEGMSLENRLRCLDNLRELGYQVGSGNIIGLPGQTLEHIAEDIIFFKKHDLDMIGIGPFIPHGESRFAHQSKGEAELVLKVVALTRIVTKNAHIPATTALGSLDKDYRLDGLRCGANVLMPNFTPQPYRKLYEIYPGKRCVDEPIGACNFCMDSMARSIGRFIDYTKGDSLKNKEINLNV
ncbi:MAG: [FeFe] hydrogenase H-cluster radical SAM maturase HydE [Candidatus Omnitrophica bacterium]|nr:[FeFe] hydrogenase H-cluster radical SAM maturase HydE [Candidatus Omnitrophota bacterium]